MAHFYDWLSCRFPYSTGQEINGGHIVYVDHGGVKEYALDRRLKLVGSHESSVQVRTHGETLEVSGNPTKLLLGHNLYGSDNLVGTALMFGMAIWSLLGLEPSPDDWARWYQGDIEVSRVDVTRMYRPLDITPGWVPKWLSIASSVANGAHQRVTNRGAYEGNTLYVGQHSRRISMKLYDKAAELKQHRPAETVNDEEWARWLDYAQDTLRVEITIRSMELKARGLNRIEAWTPAIGEAILDERISKLTILEGLRMSDEEVTNLPRRLLAPYTMWREGHDLRRIYSKTAFYRHRAALLPYGVDIAHVRPRVVTEERSYALGRPLKDFITGPGLEPPEGDAVRLLGMFGT